MRENTAKKAAKPRQRGNNNNETRETDPQSPQIAGYAANRGVSGGVQLPSPWKFKACPRESGDLVDGQKKRRVTKAIRRLMKRRAAVEPVIGHMKAEHRMGRNYLAHRMGDAINAILAAVGYNFRLLRRFLAQLLLRLIQIWLFGPAQRPQAIPATPQG